MWQIFAKAAAAGATSWLSGSLNRAQIRAQNAVDAQTAVTGNAIRGSGNLLNARQNSLARFNQSLGNKRQLDAGADAIEAVLVNASRQDRDMLASGFESSLQEAEAMGAQAAASAFSGAGGTVVDDVNAATALRYARAGGRAARARDTVMFDAARKAEAIFSQTASGLHNGVMFDSIDYNTNVANYRAEPNLGAQVAMAIGDSLLGSSTAGAVSNSTPGITNQSPAEDARLARYNAEAALQIENESSAETARLYRTAVETPDNTTSTFSIGSTQQVFSKYMSIGGT